MNLPRWIFIPIYGAIRATLEHSYICQAHSQAYKAGDHAEMTRLFRQSWTAMDRALAGLYITIGEVVVLVLLSFVIARTVG